MSKVVGDECYFQILKMTKNYSKLNILVLFAKIFIDKKITQNSIS
jgi:hypothetical protein